MNDNTLLILGALGLGGFFLWKMSEKDVGTTQQTAPTTPPVDPYAAYLAGMQQSAMSNTPRDPGDTNNWAGALGAGLTALGGIASSLINTYGNQGSSSSTPSGWVEPDFEG